MAERRSRDSSSNGWTVMSIVKGAAYVVLLSLLALIVAVAVATAYLPSYGELT
jgi:hypothetical protein